MDVGLERSAGRRPLPLRHLGLRRPLRVGVGAGDLLGPAWVTWSYGDRYVGWAPMPTVQNGSSGCSGWPVVLSESHDVFVPTNRFVGTNVRSVRLEPRRNAEVFRQAKPVTHFEVSGGIGTNVPLPMATMQRATGWKVETRETSTARTTSRPATVESEP